ncbi:carcinoembryonic antigen-related cell adhesion molecule 3 isoform X2 [Cricetulus griseus]|uniref:Carcinoembryonic antigen-related cell adhesion molecule 3 isoform X2 n=1 Tax=Cricetulus griseus TaxID=10029 RepID=A0A9J7H4R6_CRIGR|nr:carcinoembryonic antigen-related cell adhesion molecule 3 isoform X2 [Cricetulus griseus]
MEMSSVCLYNGCTPWQGLLLTASLLTCWHLSATAHVTIESVPPQVVEGENVLFLVHNLPDDVLNLAWAKGVNTMHLGIGTYLQSENLSVPEPVAQPFVQITDTTIAGHRSAIFTCISPDTDVSIRWIFNNQSLNHLERMTLSPTKCGLMIAPVRREDAGEYQCEVSNQVSLKTSHPVSWP